MKTKELIALLQKADPYGECHVRTGNGTPYIVEKKEGYYDGNYEYIENGKYIISCEDSKIDIQTIEWEDWIYNHGGDYSSIEFKLDSYIEKEDFINRYIDKFNAVSSEYRRIEQQMKNVALNEILKKMKEGHVFYQEKDTDIDIMNIYYRLPPYEPERLSFLMFDVLTKSGYFEQIVKDNKLFWVIAL